VSNFTIRSLAIVAFACIARTDIAISALAARPVRPQRSGYLT
jgi:hypothetical protein